MKRFALAAALLVAAIGLNVGCGGQTTDTTPAESGTTPDAPAVNGDTGDDAAADDTAAGDDMAE